MTTIQATDLVRFLLARLGEDERDALEASFAEDPLDLVRAPAAWSPRRTLTDCSARRVILDGCRRLDHALDEYGVAAPFDGLEVMRWLAVPYADHPDYRPEWRP